MVRVVHAAEAAMREALERGGDVVDIVAAGVLAELGRMRRWPVEEADESATRLTQLVTEEMRSL